MKISNRTNAICRNIGRQPRIFLRIHCLLIALVTGLIAVPSIAQGMSASENIQMAPQEGEPELTAAGRVPLTISSVAEADRLLKDVEAQRDLVNARYKDEEARCLTRFFVTSCIDDAKERRRVGLRSIRSIEVQANAFKRAYKAEQRDRDLQRNKPVESIKPDLPRSEDVGSHLREEPNLYLLQDS